MKRLLIVGLSLVGWSAQVWSAGFEKTNLWSGKYAGRVGAAVSSSEGPDSIYFNPARLVYQDTPNAITGNFSPTYVKFDAPITNSVIPPNYSDRSGDTTLSPVFALNYNRKINENLSLAGGYYVVGGNSAKFSGIPYGAASLEQKVNLSVTELAVGGAYRVMPGLTIGATLRNDFVRADYHTSNLNPTAPTTQAIQTNIDNLQSNSNLGYRLGVAYNPDTKWGVGISYRSQVDFSAKGDLTQTLYSQANGSAITSATNSDAKLASTLPQQVNLGGHFALNDTFTLFGEYSWTQYSVVNAVSIDATGLGGKALPSITAKWSDQNVFKVAGEYTGMALPVRFGYAYTSQVTNTSYATPLLAAPGVGHTFTLGTTYDVTAGLQLNGAIEYAMVQGTVGSGDQSSALTPAVGTYKAVAFPVAHLGATYFF